jgi:hypothetical protein
LAFASPGFAQRGTFVTGAVFADVKRFSRDTISAATIGMEARIRLSTHLAVVPEVRASAFRLSGAGPSGFAIRPGVGVRWTF